MHVEYADVKLRTDPFPILQRSFLVVDRQSWRKSAGLQQIKKTNKEERIINLNPDNIRINIIY